MNSRTTGRNTRAAGIALIALIAFLIGFAALRSARLARSMSVSASESQRLDNAAPGTVIKLVVEIVVADENGNLRGQILKKKTEDVYTRTNATAAAHWSSQTKFVMGNSSDLRKGAIVHMTGKVQSNHGLDADQIVILTAYVKTE